MHAVITTRFFWKFVILLPTPKEIEVLSGRNLILYIQNLNICLPKKEIR